MTDRRSRFQLPPGARRPRTSTHRRARRPRCRWRRGRRTSPRPSNRAWSMPRSTRRTSRGVTDDGRRGGARPARTARQHGLDRPVPPDRGAVPAGGGGVRPPRGRRRGRDRRPPAAQARALRRHAVRGAARRDLPGRGRRGRVRRDPRVRRAELRADRAPQPDARPRRRPAPDGGRPRAAGPRPGGRAVRDPRQRRGRLRAGRRRAPEGHRRDRDRGLPRRPGVSRRIYELSREVIEFQRATRPLLGMLDAWPPASRSTAPTRSCSGTCATWPTTPRPWPSASPASARTCPTS